MTEPTNETIKSLFADVETTVTDEMSDLIEAGAAVAEVQRMPDDAPADDEDDWLRGPPPATLNEIKIVPSNPRAALVSVYVYGPNAINVCDGRHSAGLERWSEHSAKLDDSLRAWLKSLLRAIRDGDGKEWVVPAQQGCSLGIHGQYGFSEPAQMVGTLDRKGGACHPRQAFADSYRTLRSDLSTFSPARYSAPTGLTRSLSLFQCEFQ